MDAGTIEMDVAMNFEGMSEPFKDTYKLFERLVKML